MTGVRVPTRTDVRTARVALLPGDAQRPRLELRGGLVSPRVVRQGAASAEVALIATTATLLGGDELRLSVEVGPGLRLDHRDLSLRHLGERRDRGLGHDGDGRSRLRGRVGSDPEGRRLGGDSGRRDVGVGR